MVVCLPMSLVPSSCEAAACCTTPKQVPCPPSTEGLQPAGCSTPAVQLDQPAILITDTAAGAADDCPSAAVAAAPRGRPSLLPVPGPCTPATPTSGLEETRSSYGQPSDAEAPPGLFSAAAPDAEAAAAAAAHDDTTQMLSCAAHGDEVPMMDASVFFACAPLCVTTEELREVFGACGELEDIQLYRSFPKCRVSKGCGIITFATQEGADAALERLNGAMPFARARKPLTVRRDSAPPPAPTKPAACSSSSSGAGAGAGARNSTAASGAARVRQPSSSSPGALQAMQWASLQANLNLSSGSGGHSPDGSSGFACMAPGGAHLTGGWCNSEPLPPGLQVGSPAAAVVSPALLPGAGSPASASLLLSGVAGGNSPGSGFLHSGTGLTWAPSTQTNIQASPSRLSASGSPAAQVAGIWPPQGPGGVLMSPDSVAVAMNQHLQQQQAQQQQQAHASAAAVQQHSGVLLSPQVMASNAAMSMGVLLPPLQEEGNGLQQQHSLPVLTMAGMRQLHRWESAPSRVGAARPPRPGVRPSWASPAAGSTGQQGDGPYSDFAVDGPAAGLVSRVHSAPAGMLLSPQMRAQLMQQQPWLLGQVAPPSGAMVAHQQLLAQLAAQHGHQLVLGRSPGSESGFSSSCGTPSALSGPSATGSSSSWLALLEAQGGCGEVQGVPGSAALSSSHYSLAPPQQVQQAASMAQQLQLSGVSGLGPQALPGDCQLPAAPCPFSGPPLCLAGLGSDMAMLLVQQQQQQQQDVETAVVLAHLFGTGA